MDIFQVPKKGTIMSEVELKCGARYQKGKVYILYANEGNKNRGCKKAKKKNGGAEKTGLWKPQKRRK